jgi:hypothetical protein
MTPKDYLKQYRESITRSAEIEQHLAELKAEAVRLKDHEGHSIALDAAVAAYVDACNASAAELSRLAQLRADIERIIDSEKNEKLHTVLYRHYILGETWVQVAAFMHYEYRSITRMHGQALLEVRERCP